MYFDDVDLKIMGNSLRTHYISVENLWKLSKYANKVSKKDDDTINEEKKNSVYRQFFKEVNILNVEGIKLKLIEAINSLKDVSKIEDLKTKYPEPIDNTVVSLFTEYNYGPEKLILDTGTYNLSDIKKNISDNYKKKLAGNKNKKFTIHIGWSNKNIKKVPFKFSTKRLNFFTSKEDRVNKQNPEWRDEFRIITSDNKPLNINGIEKDYKGDVTEGYNVVIQRTDVHPKTNKFINGWGQNLKITATLKEPELPIFNSIVVPNDKNIIMCPDKIFNSNNGKNIELSEGEYYSQVKDGLIFRSYKVIKSNKVIEGGPFKNREYFVRIH